MDIKGKTLLITGGTGSFGNVVLRRFLREGIGEVRVFSRDEKKQEDMRLELKNDRVKFYIGDVREPDSLRAPMRGVDFIFHAAALKQVPSCEFYPMEAVRTNVLGASNVLEAAIDAGAQRVVVLSTDKAVYPINAMGISKAMMEKITVARARLLAKSDTTLCATRYGNVMASRGSVIPLFVSQVKAGQPITITDPNMTRFLMSLEESVDLVIYAYRNAEQGDIFIKKAPASTIGHLAEAVMQIFDKRVPVKVIGTRHGEKRYESLVSREEMARAIDHGGYYRVPQDDRDLNYAKYFVEGESAISMAEDYTSDNTELLDVEGVKKLLLGLDYIQAELQG
ncbi:MULTISPECIES: polysaccharide biosynthesis protein [unclassified Bosea (in: a-proteobacteria)]|uniref:polysaccharide biosynthesis protein n=1 Tax=unclassified Bosea (in: a-proteobacteria) TaxID=2653178 RepID=UPI000F74FD72|nr:MULTISPECIES: polysaccharide biosynthesis protein [unclassified Bosea (in: a-proteobacteria)]AZO80475.1 UDP-glucose 4-epimerase [Bosea sp. Tri-49]RXT23278.1 UDP-glucose 4-epimerase [Bosea sp. Tri-39]RXT38750.1 UDP-glucose 4-epimerase [Bosea sp. Tri-54]